MSFGGDIKCSDLLGEGWEKNAAYLWGIPLHPMGELNSLDYIMLAQGNPEEMRARSGSLSMQLMFNVIFAFIFSRSLYLSIRMTYRRHRMLASWCCVLQAAAGVVYSLSSLAANLPNGPSCRATLWITGVGATISTLCVGSTLLQKAYAAHQRNRWLLVIGIILLLPQPIIIYIAWTSPGLMTSVGGCLSCFPSYLPWVKLAMDLPINMVFSIAFLAVVYRQYRRYGLTAWARLVRNGIQTMCLVVLSNLICTFGVAFEVAGMLSEFFFILDWVVTSVLLVHHCNSMCTATERTVKTRGPRFWRKSSQAETSRAWIDSTQYTDSVQHTTFKQ
ncbi:hypothetical protein THASP1DRAFT_32860 [Thamnocephalis sphaerospora]|uniref:Uncharacterized protein n=1 Tax=Thamnocephalis sphaerospora TaxID=78915 RepID=A0A4P9XHW9_9FUNG|nr:hypothetical protein THASP1DRAFT_32860 [Thamnocephalis sphaerospora]|eukprot:RKP05305.1 hypothetical protein THASP1DRAFT_32860 [Thamnocephalis sphaerospora]